MCIHGGIVQEGKEPIEVYVIVDKAAPQTNILLLFLLINRTNMAQDVLVTVTGIPPITVTDHRMHPKLSVLALINQMGSHGRGHYIGH